MSHPTRGEWIEICLSLVIALATLCLTPHGVSGLKSVHVHGAAKRMERLTPHGVSGLKSVQLHGAAKRMESHPTRGEWIEISTAPRGG